MTGMLLSLGHTRSEGLKGVAVSAYNRVEGRQTGLSIGIVNYAEELRGVQIGLVNIARANPSGLRATPLINVGF